MSGNRSPKYDYLKQMSGTTLAGDERTGRSNKKDNFHKNAQVDPGMVNLINRAIKGETTFYNLLLDILQPTLKRDPEYYQTLTPAQIETFVRVARTGYDVRKLMNKKSARTELPPELEPSRAVLFGISGDRELGLSDRFAVFLEPLCRPAAMIPAMKEALAREMLEFHIRQAKSLIGNRIISQDPDLPAFKNSLEVLNTVNMMQKRHLQIHKRLLEITWDEKNSRSGIRIPFLRDPIYIENVNLVDDMKNWNLMILHQDPSDIILTNSHWECDFRWIPGQYMLKYLEVPNPEAKMKSRHLRRR